MSWILPPSGTVISPHFSLEEVVCRHCGKVPELASVRETAEMMEQIRAKLGGLPIKVLSWCRCEQHNRNVGGASDSYHMRGMAVDFTVKSLSPRQVQQRLKNHKGGMGSYKGFVHVDRGPMRRWGG